MVYISSYSIVPSYFDGQQKLLALGILSLGPTFGSMAFPVLMERLLETYTWRGVLLIMSGIILNMCVTALICAPKTYANKQLTKEKDERLSSGIENTIGKKVENNIVDDGAHVRTLNLENQIHEKKKRSAFQKFRSILKIGPFLLFVLSIMLVSPLMTTIMNFFIDFYESKDIDRSIGVWLYFGMNAANCVIRIFLGLLYQRKGVPKLATACCIIFIGSIDMLMFTFARSVLQFAILACVFGAVFGGFIGIMSITVHYLTGEDLYSMAYGLLVTLAGIANIVAGPLLGKCCRTC